LKRIHQECEKTKKSLSAAFESEITVTIGDEDPAVKITRAKFEEMCEPGLKKIIPIVEKALKDAKLKKTDIDNIVMVGGTTRMPKV